MSRLGADPDALADLGLQLRRAAARMDDAAATLDRRLVAAGWRGPDADRFGADWRTRHRLTLQRSADGLRGTAQRLDRQVADQQRASGADGPGPLAGSGRVTGSGRVSTTGLPTPARAAREEVQLRAGTEVVGASLTVGLRHDLSVRRLDGHRSLLTTTETRRGGATAVVGGHAGVRAGTGGSEVPLAAEGRAGVSVAQITRRQYEVADPDVGSTVARLGAEQAVGSLVSGARHMPGLGLALTAAEPAVGALGWIAERLTGTDDLGERIDDLGIAPEPDRVETLTELRVTGVLSGSMASALGVQAGTELSGALRVGESRTGDVLRSTVVEAEGSVAATLQGTLLERLGIDAPGRRTGEASLRIEIPAQPHDGVDLIVTATTSDGATVHQSTSNVALRGRSIDVAAALGSAADQRGRGEGVDALATLSGLDLSPDAVATTASTLRITDQALGGDVALGQGLGVGVDGEGGLRRLERIG